MRSLRLVGFLVAAAASLAALLLAFTSSGVISANLSLFPLADLGSTEAEVQFNAEKILPEQEGNEGKMITYRKLKEVGPESITRSGRSLGYIPMYDYPGYDPVPSSKASIKPGPIEHGTPLMPFLPGPSPPGPSFKGEAPEPSASFS